jgi:tetratricopeptide (TPR) repeat protein
MTSSFGNIDMDIPTNNDNTDCRVRTCMYWNNHKSHLPMTCAIRRSVHPLSWLQQRPCQRSNMVVVSTTWLATVIVRMTQLIILLQMTTTMVIGNSITTSFTETDQDVAETVTTSTTTATTTTTGKPTVIRIGTTNIQYDAPFSVPHYPIQIATVLQQYSSILDNDYTADDNIGMDDLDEFDVQDIAASWHLDLGYAHRAVMEEYINQIDDPTTLDDLQFNEFLQEHKVYALAAFQEAIRMYQELISVYTMEQHGVHNIDTADDLTDVTNISEMMIREYRNFIANTMYATAETFTLLYDMLTALVWYRAAHQEYQQLLLSNLDTEHPSTNDEIELNWAHCSLHLGVALMQPTIHDDGSSTDSAANTASLTEAMERSSFVLDQSFWNRMISSLFSDDATENDSLLQQSWTYESVRDYFLAYIFEGDEDATELYMVQFMHTEEAITYFTQAATVFRKVVTKQAKEGSDQDIVQNQQTLATIVQNLGYCIFSNNGEMSNAIDHYEEALKLYTEHIIPVSQMEPSSFSNTNKSELTATIISTTDILFALADVYLRLGQFDASKERYRQCCTLNLVFVIYFIRILLTLLHIAL